MAAPVNEVVGTHLCTTASCYGWDEGGQLAQNSSPLCASHPGDSSQSHLCHRQGHGTRVCRV